MAQVTCNIIFTIYGTKEMFTNNLGIHELFLMLFSRMASMRKPYAPNGPAELPQLGGGDSSMNFIP